MSQSTTVLFLGDFSVFLSATVAIFFVDEQDKPKRAAWSKPNGFQGSQGFERMDDAGAVVVRDVLTGRTKKLGTGETSKRRALQFAIDWAERETARSKGAKRRASDESLKAAFYQWLQSRELAEKTRRDYEYAYTGKWVPHFGEDRLIRAVTPDDIQRFAEKCCYF